MATVYLSPTGSDSYTYAQAQSISTPWLTPGKVQSAATDGDTVSLASGTYTIGGAISFTGKAFTWAAQTNGAVIWDWNNAQYALVFDTASKTNSFTGIKFYRHKFNINYGTAQIVPRDGVTLNYNDCIFEDYILKDIGLGVGGIVGTYNASSVTATFSRCVIKNPTYDTASTNTAFWASRNGTVISVVVNNCVVYSSSTTAAIGGMFRETSAGSTIVSGKNNIFYAASAIPWGISNSTMTYSDGYQVTSFPANTGNITSDPLFVDAANGNYNLRPTSPCIGSGSV